MTDWSRSKELKKSKITWYFRLTLKAVSFENSSSLRSFRYLFNVNKTLMVKYKLTKTCFSLHRHGQPGHRLHDPDVHLFYDEHHPAVGVQSHAGRVFESQQVMAQYMKKAINIT